jgi:hypothetical protein
MQHTIIGVTKGVDTPKIFYIFVAMQWKHNNVECQFICWDVVNYLQSCNHVNFKKNLNMSKVLKESNIFI